MVCSVLRESLCCFPLQFQTELRKILVSLIEVAQKLLALNPDAVELFKKANGTGRAQRAQGSLHVCVCVYLHTHSAHTYTCAYTCVHTLTHAHAHIKTLLHMLFLCGLGAYARSPSGSWHGHGHVLPSSASRGAAHARGQMLEPADLQFRSARCVRGRDGLPCRVREGSSHRLCHLQLCWMRMRMTAWMRPPCGSSRRWAFLRAGHARPFG